MLLLLQMVSFCAGITPTMFESFYLPNPDFDWSCGCALPNFSDSSFEVSSIDSPNSLSTPCELLQSEDNLPNSPGEAITLNKLGNIDNTVDDIEVNLTGYQFERLDRNRHGGGVGIFVRNGIRYTRRTDLEVAEMESICIEFKVCKTPCIFVCVYRPPNSTASTFFECLDDLTCESSRENKEIIIIGDLNSDYLSPALPQTIKLMEFCQSNQLKQLINHPT